MEVYLNLALLKNLLILLWIIQVPQIQVLPAKRWNFIPKGFGGSMETGIEILLEEFKNDMSTNFTLTKEQNENISKLLETLPLLTPSEPLVESPKECLGATGSTCQELEFPSQNERVVRKLMNGNRSCGPFWKNSKKDMSTNFTLTKAQNENISKLLETLPPDKPSSLEPLVKPTALADEISEKLFNTLNNCCTE
ncbi:hypothetical protein TNCT_24321, partial [Trichonephila clavata]